MVASAVESSPHYRPPPTLGGTQQRLRSSWAPYRALRALARTAEGPADPPNHGGPGRISPRIADPRRSVSAAAKPAVRCPAFW